MLAPFLTQLVTKLLYSSGPKSLRAVKASTVGLVFRNSDDILENPFAYAPKALPILESIDRALSTTSGGEQLMRTASTK